MHHSNEHRAAVVASAAAHPASYRSSPQEEEEYLIDLMREEEAAEKRRQDAAQAAAKREASKQVRLWGLACASKSNLHCQQHNPVAWSQNTNGKTDSAHYTMHARGTAVACHAMRLVVPASIYKYLCLRHGGLTCCAGCAVIMQEMMAANAALLALKAQREAQQRAEEEAFRAAMMAKLAEDDRIEQLNAQKRRLKVRASSHSHSTASWVVAAVCGTRMQLLPVMSRKMCTCRGQ
jgi:hypothetical protein